MLTRFTKTKRRPSIVPPPKTNVSPIRTPRRSKPIQKTKKCQKYEVTKLFGSKIQLGFQLRFFEMNECNKDNITEENTNENWELVIEVLNALFEDNIKKMDYQAIERFFEKFVEDSQNEPLQNIALQFKTDYINCLKENCNCKSI